MTGYGYSPRGHIAAHSGGNAAVSAAVARANAATSPTPNLLPSGWRLGARWRAGRDGGDVLPSHWSDGEKLFSYGTCLAQPDTDNPGDYLYNATIYSVTTSKYQGDALQSARACAEASGGRVRWLYNVPRGTRDLSACRLAQRAGLNRLGVWCGE